MISRHAPRSTRATARWSFWVAFTVLAWIHVLYPVLLVVRASMRPQPVGTGDRLPPLTVIVAAHNEQRVIAAKLENLRRLDYPPDRLELIVVSDGSTDQTEAIVEQAAGPIRLLRLPWSGKAAAVEAGARAARGEILVFTDANSMLRPDALRALARPFTDVTVGGVAGDQRYTAAAVAGDSRGERGYWRLDRSLKRAESAAGSVVGATGAIYAIRRKLFRAIPAGVNDDYYLSAGVVHQGYRLVFAADAIAEEPVAADLGREFGRKIRVMSRAFRTELALCGLLDPRRHGFYSVQMLSHKILRRAGVIPLAVLLVSSVAAWQQGPFYRISATGQTAVYALGLLGLGGRVSHPVFSLPAYFVASNAAGAVALFNLLRRRRVERWTHERTVPRPPQRDP